MKAPRIVCVGGYNRDVVLRVDRFPRPGETRLGLGRLESPGGKGSNQAVQMARCGVSVGLIAAVGTDAAGDEALALWAAHGVDAAGVARLEGVGTGMALILVNGEGENQIVVDSGANARLHVGHVRAAELAIAASGLVVAQLETPIEATVEAFRLARRHGARTLLNAAPAPGRLPAELLALTDFLCVNAGEAAALSGAASVSEMGSALLEMGFEAVILTLGAEGARLFEKGRAPLTAAPVRVVPVDTTGAGDAFIGAFAAKWAETLDFVSALAFATAAGALACTRMGAAASFGDFTEIAALGSAR